jgi:hypothetical protein
MTNDTTPTSRTQALTVDCPRCNAEPGDPCTGTRGPRESAHRERHDEYTRTHERQHDVRPYDLKPDYFDNDGWTPKPMIEIPGGGLAYPLDDDTCERGLRNIAAIREQLTKRQRR